MLKQELETKMRQATGEDFRVTEEKLTYLMALSPLNTVRKVCLWMLGTIFAVSVFLLILLTGHQLLGRRTEIGLWIAMGEQKKRVISQMTWELILPALTLAASMSAKYTRQVRTAVLGELRQDYVTGARMRGLRERQILWFHVLPNAMLPLVTLLGLSLGSLLGGTAVVEIIYNWPGLGSMAVKAISCRDYPLVQGYVLWVALLYMGINLLVDLSYKRLDPRLKEGL